MQVRDTRDFTEGRWIKPTNQYPKDNIQDNQTIETNQSQSMKWRHDNISRGSRACRHASPRCVPLHHVVRWLIGIIPSLSKGATRTYQMVRSFDTSNPLELEFGSPPGNHNNPSQQAHRSRPRTITNTCRTSTAAPSRLGDGNHQEKQESRSKRTPRCQLDANSQANALEITQSRFD
jgi:hypothetical protein